MSLRHGRETVAIPGPSIMPERVLAAFRTAMPNIYEGELIETSLSILADLPAVAPDATMLALIAEISRGRLGMSCVRAADGTLEGVVTDGDLRRRMIDAADPLEGCARDVMTATPVTLGPDALASEALRMMEDRKITSVPIVDGEQRVLGVIQIHDLWRTELF